MQRAALGLILMAALPVTGASAAGGVSPREIVKDAVYRTVDGRPLHLDIYTHPDTAKAPGPVLVHFHGGGWTGGARPQSWTGFRPYLAAGFSVVTVQYRLAGEAPAPAAVQDARCALHWIGANAARFGFDGRRIVVSGTSAGAHLALMAGLLPAANDIDAAECKNGPRAAAILDFYGPADLIAAREGSPGRHPTVANWIGKRSDPEAMERQMSPVGWLSADGPPIFIGHGDADPVVPVAQSIDLKRRLDALSVPSDLFVVRGGGHGKFDPASQAALTARAIIFLCARRIAAVSACDAKN
ncbi:MAG TPA: alpha/beta hydrolase [Sphingopyxis sp.]|uniref:alpha/beta hydrolase n=1 Tax=Sphingopyxis sp. TaxID=1908224 RepID=UPI002C50560A|nr:alpha/beta hydrolase [Sphingopyxis sp.]HWW59018.1 alpha/beta hydrolase [Sphingopyxis sp.]